MHWTGVFLYNRLVWCGLGLLALIACFALFPMSVEALTAVSSKRRAAKAASLEQEDPRPKRSIVAATAARRPPNFRLRHNVASAHLPHKAPPLQHPSRNSVLGARLPSHRLRHQQWLLRRTHRWPRRLARHLPHGSGRRRLRDSLLLYRRHALRRRTRLARTRHPFRRHPRRASHARNHRLAQQVFCAGHRRTHSSRRHHGLRHLHADPRRLLPLRNRPIPQGTFRRHLPAGADLHPLCLLHPNRRQQQIRRPRNRDRAFRLAPDPLSLWIRKHALSRRARRPPTPTAI